MKNFVWTTTNLMLDSCKLVFFTGKEPVINVGAGLPFKRLKIVHMGTGVAQQKIVVQHKAIYAALFLKGRIWQQNKFSIFLTYGLIGLVRMMNLNSRPILADMQLWIGWTFSGMCAHSTLLEILLS